MPAGRPDVVAGAILAVVEGCGPPAAEKKSLRTTRWPLGRHAV